MCRVTETGLCCLGDFYLANVSPTWLNICAFPPLLKYFFATQKLAHSSETSSTDDQETDADGKDTGDEDTTVTEMVDPRKPLRSHMTTPTLTL